MILSTTTLLWQGQENMVALKKMLPFISITIVITTLLLESQHTLKPSLIF